MKGVPPRGRPAAVAAGGALVLLLAVLTWNRAAMYQDPVAFFRDNVSRNPQATEGWHQLGLELSRRGEIRESVVALQRAVAVEPSYALGHANLGAMLLADGQTSAAVARLEEALRLDSNLEDARYNLDLARSSGGASLSLEFKRSE